MVRPCQGIGTYPLRSCFTAPGSVSSCTVASAAPCSGSTPELSGRESMLARKAARSAGSNRGCPLAFACRRSSILAALICISTKVFFLIAEMDYRSSSLAALICSATKVLPQSTIAVLLQLSAAVQSRCYRCNGPQELLSCSSHLQRSQGVISETVQ